jgi:transposase
VGEKRKGQNPALRFFHWLGRERSQALQCLCSDMWRPSLKVIAKKAGQAIHVLDRCHLMAHLNQGQ